MKLLTFLLTFIVTLMLVPHLPAHAATTPSSTVLWQPLNQSDTAYAYVDTMTKLVEGAPRGATFRAGWYLFNDVGFKETLEKAHARGVHIQLVIDQSGSAGQRGYQGQPGMTEQMAELTSVLGTDTSKPDFLLLTKGSPFSKVGYQHAKFFTLSSTVIDGVLFKQISSEGSNNPTYSNTLAASGEAQIFWGDTVLYRAFLAYHKAMLTEKTRNYYRTVKSGTVTLSFFPSTKGRHDVLADRLDGITKAMCQSGKVTVQMAMFAWTSARLNVAERLWLLASWGCKVNLILNWSGVHSTNIAPVVWAALFKKGTKIVTLTGYNPAAGVHLKTTLIHYSKTMVVIDGSRNLTGGQASTSEITGQNTSPQVYAQYDAYLAKVRALSHPILTKPTYVPATPNSRTVHDPDTDD